jgi:hypothetical protein
MARAGQRVVLTEDRLEDRISLGVLAKAFPRALIEEVIAEAGAKEQRNRMLPAWLTLYYVLALALFMDMGGGRVMRKLAGTLNFASRGVVVQIPSEEALSNARSRLGSKPLKALFEKVARPLAVVGDQRAYWRGYHVMALDGTTLDVQDTPANWDYFGGPGTKDEGGKTLRGGFPQLRIVALAECGTRALVAAVAGSYNNGEKTLAAELILSMRPGMLVLGDRNFPGYELWRQGAATGAELVWRIGKSFSLDVDEVLQDGSYLSRLKVPRQLRIQGCADITVRVIKYQLEDQDGNATETFTLATTLLDPEVAPSSELAELYQSRWEIESAFGAFKSQLKGEGVVLRSKTPDGAQQELWALLCVYHAIRELIVAAGEMTKQDPLRISFIAGLDGVRGPVGDPAAFPPSQND